MSSGQRRVALVTGSTSGIGLAISRRFALSGHDVIITGIAEQEAIDKILDEFKNYKVRCSYVGGDFTKEEDMMKLCKDITAIYPEGIDILINNAGFQHVCSIDEYPIDIWNKMVAVHLTASFLLIKYFVPYMKKKGWGRIVNTSSQMGLISTPGKTPYSAVKAALIGLAKGTALETAEYGITCNAICPGYVETDLVTKQIHVMAEKEEKSFEQKRNEFFGSVHPSKKPVTVEQVSGLVLYLCSDDAASTTGSAISIDGGYTAQ
ncbi:D-beta-hydroxybutyrate dehydrogenase-like [Ruditapes philippinarum]|uniref:D-beta-hydroxybutyrate dehydrogenase-like n=1 Tax=Ruditapes philippinarum TaxID=129788 RepID=UPI00295B4B00|nr:D-beta-hydroxybutyrate dehydrogenase-like [Ruditapes philippinarum]XP_060608060.1 D-beta-hydroxybutyrate dehydrogenase-like [Ruditapes philippinarum]